jgi:hypothetical protein
MPFGHLSPTFERETRTDRREAMDETYRMLGRERELDLEREAQKRRLAAALPAKPARTKAVETGRVRRTRLVARLLTAWLAR